MPWTEELLRRMADPNFPALYIFEPIADMDPRSAGDFYFTSKNGRIARRGQGGSGGRVQVASWTYARGTWSVPLALTPKDLADVKATRGLPVWLRLGWPGLAEDDYEPVALGVLRNIRYQQGGGWLADCDDITALLSSRSFESTIASGGSLFTGAGADTTVAGGAYAVGDATLNLDATADAPTANRSGLYCVLVTGNTGDPFYLTATGKTPTTLTGCSAVGQFGSTAHAAANGNAVQFIAYDEDHPVTMALRILESSGTPLAKGVYDSMPRNWGFAIPDTHIDTADALQYSDFVVNPSSGTSTMTLLVAAEQPDGEAFLKGWLSPLGVWICTRQGQLTVRAACAPVDAIGEILDIDHTDIRTVTSYERWAEEVPVEYEEVEYDSADLDADGNPVTTNVYDDTIAAADTNPNVTRGFVTIPGVRATSPTEWLTRIAVRLGAWATRIPEVLELDCRGWRLAQLTPGDWVRVTTSQVGDRTSGSPTLASQLCLVLSVNPNWWGASTTLRLAIQPSDGAEIG